MKVQALLDLLLGEELAGDPGVNLTANDLGMHLVCFLVHSRTALSNLLQSLQIHLFVLESTAEWAPSEG